VHLAGSSSSLRIPPRSRVINQNAAHHSGANREEVRPVLPLHPPDIDEAKIRFMNQCSRLYRVFWTFPAQASLCDISQLWVGQLHNPVKGALVTGGPDVEQFGDIRARGVVQLLSIAKYRRRRNNTGLRFRSPEALGPVFD